MAYCDKPSQNRGRIVKQRLLCTEELSESYLKG